MTAASAENTWFEQSQSQRTLNVAPCLLRPRLAPCLPSKRGYSSISWTKDFLTLQEDTKSGKQFQEFTLLKSLDIDCYRFQPDSTLPSLSAYLKSSQQILSLILQIPPVDPSTSLRTALLLRLTNDAVTSITGYPCHQEVLPELLDWMDDLDQAWMAVLQSQIWDPEHGEGVDLVVSADEALAGFKSTPTSQTDRARLRSLIIAGLEALGEWSQATVPEDLAMQANFDNLFSRITDGLNGAYVVDE